ncbi:MAG: hypothetical protein KKD01_19230 [Proteobacteria bacterium]|nr:hypothetical protein [Pseudomonadota bacterium]MBU1139366.1 hypothetical protein [Pseudomonadota bacterium]MBU1234469.1 hypothetical protein [Pseudomonadota bacterium]MBU1418464.1 hypothetical protein [Pseudomonadota bacterium]MBU1456855.1 hypothetical protein [Pseudomonadota bacterium]
MTSTSISQKNHSKLPERFIHEHIWQARQEATLYSIDGLHEDTRVLPFGTACITDSQSLSDITNKQSLSVGVLNGMNMIHAEQERCSTIHLPEFADCFLFRQEAAPSVL